MVWLNPWELACLAVEMGLTTRIFRDRYCDFGGIRLRFNGPSDKKGQAACSLYQQDRGCSVHAGRPLACRLFPLGRQRCGNELHYIHRGTLFPCLEDCPHVADLPRRSVTDYLAKQNITAGEAAQDAYLELMQDLADGAFALLVESPLAASGDHLTLRQWRELGTIEPAHLTQRLGSIWIDRLLLPEITDELCDPAAFCRRHHDILKEQVQTSFEGLADNTALREASGLMMGLALHLSRALGMDPTKLAEHWIKTAKGLGVR